MLKDGHRWVRADEEFFNKMIRVCTCNVMAGGGGNQWLGDEASVEVLVTVRRVDIGDFLSIQRCTQWNWRELQIMKYVNYIVEWVFQLNVVCKNTRNERAQFILVGYISRCYKYESTLQFGNGRVYIGPPWNAKLGSASETNSMPSTFGRLYKYYCKRDGTECNFKFIQMNCNVAHLRMYVCVNWFYCYACLPLSLRV